MRWLVFFLLVLNGLTFSWFMFQGDQQKYAASESEKENFDFDSVSRLTLLSELPEPVIKARDVRLRQQTESVKTIPVEPEEVVEVDITSDGLELEEGGGLDEIDQAIGIDEDYDEEVAIKKEHGFVEMDVNARCALIGPFPEVVSAKQAKGRLDQRGLASTPVVVNKELPPIHWVYIPPKATRKMALATLKSLQAKNIDSFIISDGEYRNGISLGFFSSLKSANEVMDERRAQGYEVAITDRIREQQSYWVAFDGKTSRQVTEDTAASLQVGNLDLKKQEKSCVDVALLEIIE